jgi:hypothetical protein
VIKRIPCRVVRSKPLGKSRDVGRFNHFHHKIGDVLTGSPQDKYTSKPTTYTRLLEITSVSMDNGLAGQILDCYV